MGISEKYRVENRLGAGRFAEVFVASMQRIDGATRRVAIKRILPELAKDSGFARKLAAEAQLSSRLIHPNIVSVFDLERDAEGRLVLVTELVDGIDLHALSATGLLPIGVVIHVIVETLRALGYAHGLERGVPHRNLTSRNVLLSWGGEVKVSDFGLGASREATPDDVMTDILAAGLILRELLVGLEQVASERSDSRDIKLRTPREFRPEVPKDLDAVAMRLLERDPTTRYGSAETAIPDLLACKAAPAAGSRALCKLLGERFAGESNYEGRPLIARATSLEVSTTIDARLLSSRPRRIAGGAMLVVLAATGGYLVVRGATDGEASGTPSDARAVEPQPMPSGNIAIEAKYGPQCAAFAAELDRLVECAQIPAAQRELFREEAKQFADQMTYVNYKFGAGKPMEATCEQVLVTYSTSYGHYCAVPDAGIIPGDAGSIVLPPNCIALLNEFDELSRCAVAPLAVRQTMTETAATTKASISNWLGAPNVDRDAIDNGCATSQTQLRKSASGLQCR